MKMINEKVYLDYRDNILIDKNNPVLAFKANRDRYFKNGNQNDYAGLSHLGSINSEDAITWNLIRSISQYNNFSSIEKLLNIKIASPKYLIWNLAFNEDSYDLQYLVSSFIRSIDGIYKGQITEPDIIIETKEYFIVFECKLGEINKFPNHLQESSKGSKGPEIRKNNYSISELFKSYDKYDSELYQLYRMVFYTFEIAKKNNKIPIFVSLTNKTWWEKERRDKTKPSTLWSSFLNQVDSSKIRLINIFWQDIEIYNDEVLKNYLNRHKCLY